MGTVAAMSIDQRRDYGSGAVFQRSDGMWIGRIEAGWNASGNRRRVQVSAKTEDECKRRLVKKRREIEASGLPVEGVSGKTTVKTWAENWIEGRRADLGSKTFGTYAGIVRKWIIPTIGNKQLHALTPGDLRALTKAEIDAGNKLGSALVTRRVLIKCLRDAMVEGHKIPPRLFEVAAPQPPKSDREDIPIDDAFDLLTASLSLEHCSRWLVGFFEGMRQGEVLGLMWDHVDLDRGLIDVEWQLQPLPYLDRAAGTFSYPTRITPKPLWKSYHLVPPKTEGGHRIIPIVGPVHAALTQWRDIAPESPHGLVWPRSNGRPTNPQADTAEWIWLQDQAQVAHVEGSLGRRYEGHEIRHTTATVLLGAGIDPETVKTILGHSSIITSRMYQHVSHNLARDAMEKVAERFAFTLPTKAIRQ